MATSAPMPVTAAFWTSSKPMRPLTSITGTPGILAGQHARADDLVHRVVAADVLADVAQRPVGVDGGRRVQAAGAGEDPLVLAQALRQAPAGARGQEGGTGGPSALRRPASVSTSSMLSVPHTPQADEVASTLEVRTLGGASGRRGQGDGDDVELLLGRQRHVGAVGDAGQLGARQHALAGHHPGRELEVVARRAHGDADPLGRSAGPGQADLQRLLGGQPVLARSPPALGVLPDADADRRSGTAGQLHGASVARGAAGDLRHEARDLRARFEPVRPGSLTM